MAVSHRADVRIDLSPDSFVPGVPHDQFDWLRANAPVYYHPQSDGPGFWCVTKRADIIDASRDHETFSNAKGFHLRDFADGAELMLAHQDPPRHTQLRGIVSRGFHPKMINAIEPHVREIVTGILDRVAPNGECDFVTEVAAELPLEVIAEFAGVPPEDRHKIFEWSNTMIAEGGDPEYSPSLEDATRAFFEIVAYAEAMAAERRLRQRDDLVSAIVSAEVDGEKLSEIDMAAFFALLMIAGNETTRNLISGGMQALCEHPDQLERLVADPSLIPTAAEEMLRWVSPVMYFRRTATREVEIRGETIRDGEKVLLWYVAGNRDEEAFPEPHHFDVARTPNEHVTFGGGGPHFCLGFSLAQLEIKVMFEELLPRLRNIELAGPVQRMRSNFVNGIRHMPVRFTPERP